MESVFIGENGYLDSLGIDSEQYGVCHEDELFLMRNPLGLVNYTLNEVRNIFIKSIFPKLTKIILKNDSAMGEIMVKYWVDFASTGRQESY